MRGTSTIPLLLFSRKVGVCRGTGDDMFISFAWSDTDSFRLRHEKESDRKRSRGAEKRLLKRPPEDGDVSVSGNSIMKVIQKRFLSLLSWMVFGG